MARRVWDELGLDLPDNFPDLVVSEMYSPERLAAAVAVAVSAGGDADGAADGDGAVDLEPAPGPVSDGDGYGDGGKFARHTAALHRLEGLVGVGTSGPPRAVAEMCPIVRSGVG